MNSRMFRAYEHVMDESKFVRPTGRYKWPVRLTWGVAEQIAAFELGDCSKWIPWEYQLYMRDDKSNSETNIKYIFDFSEWKLFKSDPMGMLAICEGRKVNLKS